jgi:HAD superfamily hydrolase (TIGR01509 family)
LTGNPSLLFDIDGTLSNTEHYHLESMRDYFARFGVPLGGDEFKTRIVGRSNSLIFAEYFPDRTVAEHRHMADEKEALFREMAQAGLSELPGLGALLDWADVLSLPMAVVTNAPRPNADAILGALDIMHRFQAKIISDELAHGKPHPLPYLTGLDKIGGDAARSVAFEDSISGITAALAAGLPVVGLMTSASEAQLLAAGVSLAIDDFEDARLRPFLRQRLGL